MYVYIFKSDLFEGQPRKIVSNFPLDILDLIELVNADNHYTDDENSLERRRWYLAEQY